MKVIFMGTPDFAVVTLEKIIEAGHEVIGVVTQPDKPKGRGKAMQFSPVKEKAEEHNLTVYQPVRAKDEAFIRQIQNLNPDVIVVAAFGQILPKAILDIPKYGCINVHASLLPRYRGAAPIQWAVIDGEKETGVTIMLMDAGLDTGDMLKKAVVKLEEKETGGSLHDKLAVIGGDLLIETLKELEAGSITREKQDDHLSNYAKMLNKALGCIDFQKSAVEIERLIRGLNPWPSAYTGLDDKTLKIWNAKVIDREYEGEPGEVVEVDKSTMIVKTGAGALALETVQLEGKKRMEIDAFLRGYTINKGIVLKKER